MAFIREIEAIPVRIALRASVVLASESIATADNLIVRVLDSDGGVGWGESASAPTMTGERLPGMVAAVRERIAPRLLGRKIEDDASWASAVAAMKGDPGARSAVEVALYDLLGRRRGLPVAALLEAEPGRTLPLVKTIGTRNAIPAAEALLAGGATHLKVKVGTGELAAEAAVLRDLRTLIGPDRHLSADANMAWTVAEAARFLEAVADAALDYLEQPVANGEIEGMAVLARSSRTPLCLDEALHGVDDIDRYHAARAASGAGLKLLKLGGFLGAVEADRAARRCGWHTTWASKIAESSLGAAAVLHAACLSDDASWGVSLTHDRLVEDLAAEPLPCDGAASRSPSGPGLGVVPDPDRLAQFRLDQ